MPDPEPLRSEDAALDPSFPLESVDPVRLILTLIPPPGPAGDGEDPKTPFDALV